MPKIYTTKQGDTLDLIAHREYGYSKGTTEQIYAANEFLLLEQSFLLEPGLTIVIPDIKRDNSTIALRPSWL